MPYIINIDEFDIPLVWVSNKMLAILRTQGLIEPLYMNYACEFKRVHDAERLAACKILGWDTVIITYPGEGKIDH